MERGRGGKRKARERKGRTVKWKRERNVGRKVSRKGKERNGRKRVNEKDKCLIYEGKAGREGKVKGMKEWKGTGRGTEGKEKDREEQ